MSPRRSQQQQRPHLLRPVHRRHRHPPQGAPPQHLEYPVGLGLLTSVYAPTGDRREVPRRGSGHASPRAHHRQGVRPSRRFRTALNVGALIRSDKHTFTDAARAHRRHRGQRRRRLLRSRRRAHEQRDRPAVIRRAAPAARARSARSSPTASASRCAVVPQQVRSARRGLRLRRRHRQRRTAFRSRGCSRAKVYLARNSFFEIGGGAGLCRGSSRTAA